MFAIVGEKTAPIAVLLICLNMSEANNADVKHLNNKVWVEEKQVSSFFYISSCIMCSISVWGMDVLNTVIN